MKENQMEIDIWNSNQTIYTQFYLSHRLFCIFKIYLVFITEKRSFDLFLFKENEKNTKQKRQDSFPLKRNEMDTIKKLFT